MCNVIQLNNKHIGNCIYARYRMNSARRHMHKCQLLYLHSFVREYHTATRPHVRVLWITMNKQCNMCARWSMLNTVDDERFCASNGFLPSYAFAQDRSTKSHEIYIWTMCARWMCLICRLSTGEFLHPIRNEQSRLFASALISPKRIRLTSHHRTTLFSVVAVVVPPCEQTSAFLCIYPRTFSHFNNKQSIGKGEHAYTVSWHWLMRSRSLANANETIFSNINPLGIRCTNRLHCIIYLSRTHV